jgi:hypothetical protein
MGSDPNHLLTVSLPLTGMPQTVPEYCTTTLPFGSFVAVPLVSVKGQFTPPCETSPLAVQLSVDPEIEPVPPPLMLMLPPHVAANETVALEVLTGVTVYWTFPQPVAGVEGERDDQVPANVSMPTAGDGDVGEEEEDESFFILSSRLQPVVRVHASASETGSQVERILRASREPPGRPESVYRPGLRGPAPANWGLTPTRQLNRQLGV